MSEYYVILHDESFTNYLTHYEIVISIIDYK